MLTTIIISIVGLLAAAGAIALSLTRATDFDPIVPDAEERWLVRTLHRYPRLAWFVRRRLDPTKAGGLLLTVGLAVVFGLSLFSGWVFDTLDTGRGFAQFDESVAVWGAENANDTSTLILNLITDLGGTGVVTVVTLITAVYGWIRHRNFHVALFIVAVVVGQALVSNGLKLLIERERPDIAQLAGWAGTSFPSGHSAAGAATYAAVALVLSIGASRGTRAWLAGGAALLAAMIGATRALLGVHWVTDVLAGLAVGWAWFTICAVAFGGRIMRFGEPAERVSEPSRIPEPVTS